MESIEDVPEHQLQMVCLLTGGQIILPSGGGHELLREADRCRWSQVPSDTYRGLSIGGVEIFRMQDAGRLTKLQGRVRGVLAGVPRFVDERCCENRSSINSIADLERVHQTHDARSIPFIVSMSSTPGPFVRLPSLAVLPAGSWRFPAPMVKISQNLSRFCSFGQPPC